MSPGRVIGLVEQPYWRLILNMLPCSKLNLTLIKSTRTPTMPTCQMLTCRTEYAHMQVHLLGDCNHKQLQPTFRSHLNYQFILECKCHFGHSTWTNQMSLHRDSTHNTHFGLSVIEKEPGSGCTSTPWWLTSEDIIPQVVLREQWVLVNVEEIVMFWLQ